MIKWLLGLSKPKEIETTRTVDGGKLAPYPDMTDDELADFEEWADELLT